MNATVDIGSYKIGDELFRYVEAGGVFRWKVVGVRQYEGETQLEVEGQTCSHGWKCRVLVARNDYGKIHAVHMLNEDEDDRQRHWHTNDGYHFWPTSAEAKREAAKVAIRKAKERVSNAQRTLESECKRLAELEQILSETTND
jgi:ABC-type Zn2+ transport system substrate-binding protein/surface adhesin